jgi:SAM-dependent methyltransferase
LFEVDEVDRGEAEAHWQVLVETGRAQARQTPLDVDTIPATMQLLDRLSAAYMCRALRDLGAYTHPNESHSLRGLLDEFHILPRYEKSVGQWLKVLDEDGLLKRQEEDVFVSPLPLPDCALDALAGEWSQVRKRMNFGPEVLRLLDYLKQSGENLADLLRGALDPLALFFPGGSWETAESLYQLNPASHYYNAIASLLLDTVARHRQAGQALRILELGAGTGGTTAALLPVLPPDETHYTYTDLSAFFIGQAQEKFRAYPFVHYRLLDIDQDPQRQGYEAHSFDVVVAANVLHDAHNLPQTLRGVLSLLAPHGLLLLVEGTRFARWEMVTIGLIEGLSAFEDERLQRNQPLLPPAEWQRVLLSSGFEKFVAFPEPGLPADLLGQHVMVAQAPPIVRRFKEQALKDFMKAKLPEYMVPAAFIVLDALPLTPNGKVDRKALPLPDQKAVHPPSTAEYVAPRTEVERALAALWQELLLVEKVGMRDNFFDLGGDSLLIVRLQSKVREAFGKELSIAEMFKYPTIGALAEYLSQVPGEPLPSQVQESRERAEARREAILQRQQGRGIPPEQARST